MYIYIYTKFIVWCEGKERSIPLQVERKQSKHTRQRSDVATLSFTPVGDLQATGSSNLVQAHIYISIYTYALVINLNCQLPEDRQPA